MKESALLSMWRLWRLWLQSYINHLAGRIHFPTFLVTADGSIVLIYTSDSQCIDLKVVSNSRFHNSFLSVSTAYFSLNFTAGDLWVGNR